MENIFKKTKVILYSRMKDHEKIPEKRHPDRHWKEATFVTISRTGTINNFLICPETRMRRKPHRVLILPRPSLWEWVLKYQTQQDRLPTNPFWDHYINIYPRLGLIFSNHNIESEMLYLLAPCKKNYLFHNLDIYDGSF